MSRFLDWYSDELSALRRRAGAFAERHPKIAGRLRMTPDAVDDPHVERLLQGFAFSAARVRQKLEDDFPELTDTVLEALYPQYLAPIPSMSVVRFEGAPGLDEPTVLPHGYGVKTEKVRGDRCHYRTTQEVVLRPLRVAACVLEKPPFRAPPARHLSARCCTSITVERTGAATFEEMGGFDPVFFVRAPLAEAARLYELVRNRTIGVAVGSHAEADDVAWLPTGALEAVGFEEDEAALPFPRRSFPGFRLLTEFFALPEKFLFFRVRLGGLTARFGGERFTVWLFGDANPDPLVRSVGATTFDLHCAPVVNLFRQQTEPLAIDRTRHEYDLVSDARRHATREIHSIDRVVLTGAGGGQVEAQPFFGRRALSVENRGTMYWQHKRVVEEDGVPVSRLAFVDLSLNAATSDEHTTASVDATCLNRTLPELLPFGGGQPHLSIDREGDRVTARMMLAPTPTTRFDRGEGATWRLVSHLSLNHLALTGGDADLLRDMLRLYDYRGAQETNALIEGIDSVESRRATARLSDGSVVAGVDVSITFDDAVDRGQAFLMGSVLSRFLGLYASINTFSRLTVFRRGVALPVARFEPRTAEEALL